MYRTGEKMISIATNMKLNWFHSLTEVGFKAAFDRKPDRWEHRDTTRQTPEKDPIFRTSQANPVPLPLFPLTFMLCLSLSLSFPDPTEKVNLQVLSPAFIKEDDNVTLKCQADGNPPPTSFNFHIKVRMQFLSGQKLVNTSWKNKVTLRPSTPLFLLWNSQ